METTKYLLKLAEQGDADAQFRLGYRLAFGRRNSKPCNWEEVVSWWQKAANQGVRRAKFYLVTCFDHGLGVEQDVNTAFACFMEAAKDDYPVAQYNVAFSYREGNGVEKNLEKAVE